jgi:hypothetical protein
MAERPEQEGIREVLHEHLDREPFVPFRLVLTSGQSYDITNPHSLAVGETLMHLYYAKSDRSATLRLNQLASIETLEPAM